MNRQPSRYGLRAVVFDVGETLVDERGLWGRWADHLGVPRPAFYDALDSVVRERQHHRQVFEAFRPGFDIAAATAARLAAGDDPGFREGDLFPDARPCIASLRAAGFKVGIVGNTSARTEAFLKGANLGADFIASAEGWGVEKPAGAFFQRIAAMLSLTPAAIAYVGDRLDNDVLPAQAADMTGVFLARGFWGRVHATWPEAAEVDLRIDTLGPLAGLLAGR